MICPHCGNDTEQQPIVVNMPANINGCNPLPEGDFTAFTLNVLGANVNPCPNPIVTFAQPLSVCANAANPNPGTVLTIKV